MPNYYVPLTAPNAGGGLNLEPINSALDSIQKQNNVNRAYDFQQKQFDATQQQRQFENARATKQDQLAEIEAYGKRATAVDQLTDPNQRAAAWKTILARHGTDGLTPEELDPVTGPKLMAAQAGQFLDPRDSQAKDLGLQKTQAEIKKLNVEAQNGGEAYGKTGAIFLNPETSRYEAVQFGGRGQVKRTDLGGLTPSRGVSEVDTGTGTQIIDKGTGAPVRTIAKDVAGEASLREQGTAQGKALADVPRQVDNARLALDTINAIRSHPGKKYGLGVYGVVPGIPGTEQRGFVNLVDQAKGQVFLQAFNSLRGGGQITEAEGSKATQALARLDRAQSQPDFDKALDDLQSVIKSGLQRAETAATRRPALPGQGAASQLPSGNYVWTPDGGLKPRQ